MIKVGSISLDLKADKVYWININNHITGYKDKKFSSFFVPSSSSIILPSSLLLSRSNQIAIYYKSHYNEGLSLKIKEERHFISSSFYPRRCHLVFPCFDQPNLAAQMELTLISAKNMKVFSNEIFLTKCTNNQRFLPSYYKPIFESGPEIYLFKADLMDEYYIWVFNKTNPMPCHQYRIAAGEWRIKKYEQTHCKEEELEEKGSSKIEENGRGGEDKKEERMRREEGREEEWEEEGKRKKNEANKTSRENFCFYDDSNRCVNLNLVSEIIREALSLLALEEESKIDVLIETDHDRQLEKRLIREKIGGVLFPKWWKDFALIDGLVEWVLVKVGAEDEVEEKEDEVNGMLAVNEISEYNKAEPQQSYEQRTKQKEKEKQEQNQEEKKEQEENRKEVAEVDHIGQKNKEGNNTKQEEDDERRRQERKVGTGLLELERIMGEEEFLKSIRKWIKHNEEKFVDWEGFVQEMRKEYGEIDKWYEEFILNLKVGYDNGAAIGEVKKKERIKGEKREYKKVIDEVIETNDTKNYKELEVTDEMEIERKDIYEEREGKEKEGDQEDQELEGVADDDMKGEIEPNLVDPSETIKEEIEKEDGGE